MRQMVGVLGHLGFRHSRPPYQETDGPLAPFDVDGTYVGKRHFPSSRCRDVTLKISARAGAYD